MNENKIEMLQKEFDDAVKNIKEAFEGLKAEIISVDKPEYKTVDRVAKVGERILITNPDDDSAGEKGEIFTVVDSREGGVDVEEIQITSSHWAFETHEYEVLVPELETVKRMAEVGESILIVNADEEQLRSPYGNGDVMTVTEVLEFDNGDVICGVFDYINFDEYEVITEPEQAPVVKELTANQQRAELIERVREFVEKYKDKRLDYARKYQVGNATVRNHYYETEFVVKGSRVTALVYWLAYGEHRIGNPRHVGRADCVPGEVFNEHIGKAIALARALEINVPEEFLNAVQPEELEVGHVIRRLGVLGEPYEAEIASISAKETYYTDGRMDWTVPNLEGIQIINDTNAIYSEVTHQ